MFGERRLQAQVSKLQLEVIDLKRDLDSLAKRVEKERYRYAERDSVTRMYEDFQARTVVKRNDEKLAINRIMDALLEHYGLDVEEIKTHLKLTEREE